VLVIYLHGSHPPVLGCENFVLKAPSFSAYSSDHLLPPYDLSSLASVLAPPPRTRCSCLMMTRLPHHSVPGLARAKISNCIIGQTDSRRRRRVSVAASTRSRSNSSSSSSTLGVVIVDISMQ